MQPCLLTPDDTAADPAHDITLLYRLTGRVLHAESVDAVIEAALDAICDALRCERASVLLFDEAGVMRFVAWRGLSDAYRRSVDGHTPWRPTDRDPEPIFVTDIDETDEPDWLKAVIRAEGIRALGFIPLVARGAVIGKFMLYHAAPHVFTAQEIDLAVTIARHVSLGVVRLRAEQDRDRIEDDLRLSEERFKAMSEDAPVMIWTSDDKGGCVHLNRMLREFWGVEAGDETFDWSGTLHPDDLAGVGDEVARALHGKKPFAVKARYRRHDQIYRVLETRARPQFGRDGAFRGMVGVNLDVTERDAAERALRDSEQRFRDLAETMPQLVWTSDSDGNVDYWNSRIALFSERHRGPDGRLDWRALIHPDDLAHTIRSWAAAMASGGEFQLAHRLAMRDGSYRWHLSRATPVRDGSGARQRWYGTATDFHDLKLVQELLKDSSERQGIAVAAAGLGVFEWDPKQDRAIW